MIYQGIKRSIAYLAVAVVLLGLAGCNTLFHSSSGSHRNASFQQGKKEFKQGNYQQAYVDLLPYAQQGDAEAQYAIGYMQFKGLGTKPNRQHAYYWTKKAADQGLPEAIQALPMFQHKKPRNAETTQTFTPPAHHAIAPVTPKKPIVAKKTNSALTISSREAPQLAREEQQLMAMPDDHYTLQVMGSHDYGKVQRVAKQSQLNRGLAFRTYFQGKYWYVLTVGNFKDRASAEAQAKAIRQGNSKYHPWVRKIKSVKQEIRRLNTATKPH